MYNFYKNIVYINSYAFPYTSCSRPSFERNLNIQNIPGSKLNVIQDLGQKEQRISMSISVIGEIRLKSYSKKGSLMNFATGSYFREEKLYEVQSSFEEQRNFLDKIANNRRLANNLTVQLPDGCIYKCMLTSISQPRYTARNKIDYDLEFIVLQEVFVPTTKKKTIYFANLGNASILKCLTALTQVGDMIDGLLDTCTGFLNTIKSATTAAKFMANSITNTISKFNVLAQSINSIINDIGDIARAPAAWVSAFKTVISGLVGCIDNAKNQLEQIKSLYSPNSGNKQSISYNVKANALSTLNSVMTTAQNIAVFGTYASVVNDNSQGNTELFKTTQEVLDSKTFFNEIYNDLLNDDNIDLENKVILTKTKQQLDLIYNQALSQAANVETITIKNPTPLTTILYQRYGNLNFLDDIINLNPNITDINNIVGELKIYG